MKIETIRYNQIMDDLKTFDIILMHGLLITSRLIELAEFNRWSHAGMVIRGKDIGLKGKENRVFLWESTDYTNLKDEIFNETKTGPMLVDLGQRIQANYDLGTDTLTAVRYLNTERTPEMYEALCNLIEEVHNTPIPSAPKLVKKVFKGRVLHKRDKHDDFFCSELLTYTLKSVGLIPEEFNSNSFEPKDYSSKGYIPLLKRSTLSKEVYISV